MLCLKPEMNNLICNKKTCMSILKMLYKHVDFHMYKHVHNYI